MSTQLAIALVTNIVTVIALIVTQVTTQRNEGRRLREARVARLSEARRSAYAELLQQCDHAVASTDAKQMDPTGEPAPADAFPEYEGFITEALRRPLSAVELMGDSGTIAAARELVEAVTDYQFTEAGRLAERAATARESFTAAARRDLDTK